MCACLYVGDFSVVVVNGNRVLWWRNSCIITFEEVTKCRGLCLEKRIRRVGTCQVNDKSDCKGCRAVRGDTVIIQWKWFVCIVIC